MTVSGCLVANGAAGQAETGLLALNRAMSTGQSLYINCFLMFAYKKGQGQDRHAWVFTLAVFQAVSYGE